MGMYNTNYNAVAEDIEFCQCTVFANSVLQIQWKVLLQRKVRLHRCAKS